MDNKIFEDYVIRTIVNTVDYDAEQDRYIVNNIVLTDEIFTKLLKFAHQNLIEEGKAKELISNIVKSVSAEGEISYHQANVKTNDIRPGCIFVLFFNNITYGRLSIELLSLNEERTYLVLETNIPGLKYKDILESRNLLWNYGFAIDFGILRNGNYYPGPSNYLLLEKFDGIEYHTPNYIHKVLDKSHSEGQKGNIKKGRKTLLELIDLINIFVSMDFSKENYNFLLNEALKCNISSFQLNILINRAKCNLTKEIDTQEKQSRISFFNSNNIRVFQEPIIITKHEQKNKEKIKELNDEIAQLKEQKVKLSLEVDSLKNRLNKHLIRYDKLLKDYNDFVKMKKYSIDGNFISSFWLSMIVFLVSVLFNIIAPWFIPTVWPKFAVALTVFGAFLGFKALNDDSGKKLWKMLGCVGAIAILLSTVLTIYGLCGGFSPDIDDKGENVQIVEDSNNLLEKELENITSKKDYENELSEEKLSSHEDNDKSYEKKDSLNKNNPLVQTHNTKTISDSVKGGKRKTEQPFKSADAASSDVHKLKEKRDMINNNLNNQSKQTTQKKLPSRSGTYKRAQNSGQYDDVEWADN